MSISAEKINRLLDYDPCTGIFTWKVYRSRTAKKGSLAGSKHDKGYIKIMINRKNHFAHRLAWIICRGEIKGEIDHINGVRDDNRIENLRDCSSSQNRLNTRISEKNKSGMKGLYMDKRSGRWVACASIKGKVIHLGNFKDFNDAASARISFIESHYDKDFYREK